MLGVYLKIKNKKWIKNIIWFKMKYLDPSEGFHTVSEYYRKPPGSPSLCSKLTCMYKQKKKQF